MKKLRYFCTLLLMAVASVAWAETETLKIADQSNWANGTQYLSASTDKVTFTATGGGNTGKFYSSDNTWRFYANENATLTISVPDGYSLSSVTPTFTIKDSGTLIYNNSTITSASAVGVSGNSVTFSIGSSSGNKGKVFFTQIEVVYTSNGSSTEPSISAQNVNITYDATDGGITFVVNNTVEGGSITASCESDWLIVDDEAQYDNEGTFYFTCDANEGAERTATVTLTYSYGESEVTKDVTVTQAAAPVVYTTIPEIFAAATSTATNVSVKFDGWVVTGVSTYNAYVTDGINGFVINASNHGFEVGNTLTSSAALACSLQLKNGYAQVTGITSATEGLTVGTGGSVDVANIAMANLAGVNTGALVSYENLTCSVDNNKYYLTDGTTTLQVYTSLYSDLANSLEDGKTYNITGVYQQYNTTKEILPRSAADIEEVIPTEPTVTVNPTAVDVDAAEHDGTITVSCENMGENLSFSVFFCEETDVTTPAEYDWITADIDNNNNVYYIIEANTATEARTAYMVVKVADADTKEVYNSNLITFTQEGFSAIRNFTFEQTSATAGTLTNEPEGVTAVFNNTYTNNKEQLTKDNSMTLTIKGMPANYKVTGITLTVKNNASKGSGTATVSIGKKEIGTLDVTGLGSTYGDQDVTIIPSFATSDLVINIAATENSVYCKKFTIEYEIMDYVGVTIKEGFTATTFSCDKALDFSNVEGITANIITDDKGSTSLVTTVRANTGLYIEGAAGDYEIPIIANADEISGNLLVATDGATTYVSNDVTVYYIFGKQNGKEAFFKVPAAGYTPSANKAALAVPITGTFSGAKEMIVIGGEATGIDSIDNGQLTIDNYYTVDGKLVKGQPTQKGIYVVNGRKVVIK